MSLRLVPFSAAWIGHDRIDIHAIYRRPRFVEDEYGEWQREYDSDGLPTWDLTGPLPIKQHTRWTAKGFEYITLADRASLETAARYGTLVDERGEPVATNWRQLYDQHQTGGPWNYRRYIEGMAHTTTLAAETLRVDVNRFGSDAVEAIRRQQEPNFKLPLHLQGIAPGGGKPVSDDDSAGKAKAPRGIELKRKEAEAPAS